MCPPDTTHTVVQNVATGHNAHCVQDVPTGHNAHCVQDVPTGHNARCAQDVPTGHNAHCVQDVPTGHNAHCVQDVPTGHNAHCVQDVPTGHKARCVQDVPTGHNAHCVQDVPTGHKARCVQDVPTGQTQRTLCPGCAHRTDTAGFLFLCNKCTTLQCTELSNPTTSTLFHSLTRPLLATYVDKTWTSFSDYCNSVCRYCYRTARRVQQQKVVFVQGPVISFDVHCKRNKNILFCKTAS